MLTIFVFLLGLGAGIAIVVITGLTTEDHDSCDLAEEAWSEAWKDACEEIKDLNNQVSVLAWENERLTRKGGSK